MQASRFALILTVLVGTAAINAVAADKDIIATAAAAGSFNTLAAALQAADLTDALKGGRGTLHRIRPNRRCL
jgi:uncharacterized surface protein with fasciclin (FAS1) repeats